MHNKHFNRPAVHAPASRIAAGILAIALLLSSSACLSDNTAQPQTPAAGTSAAAVDLHALYKQFVQDNANPYLTYSDDESSTYPTDKEPLYWFYDLDRDGTDEMLLMVHFTVPDFFVVGFSQIYIFDFVNGSVYCVFTSGIVASSRLTEKLRIVRDDDGSFFAVRSYDDGGFVNLVSVYRFQSNAVTAQIGFNFSPNLDYWRIGQGRDAFTQGAHDPETLPDGFIAVTEDALDAEMQKWTDHGETVFNSVDYD